MAMLKKYRLSLGVVLSSFLVTVVVYAQLPLELASHWDIAGNVNGYMDRFWGAFFVPILSFFLLAIFAVIPKIDPKRANFASFAQYYDRFILLIIVFLTYIHFFTLGWNLGYTFDMSLVIIPPMASLLYYIGVMMEHTKPNWFVGIRTPWTISNPEVWRRTHHVGARFFKIAAGLVFVTLLYPRILFPLSILVLVLGSFCLLFYSYWEYRKLESRVTRGESLGDEH